MVPERWGNASNNEKPLDFSSGFRPLTNSVYRKKTKQNYYVVWHLKLLRQTKMVRPF